MKANEPEAGDDALDDLLRAARPETVVPPDFAHAVWLRIAQADGAAGASASWLDRLADLLIRPRVALAGLSVVVLLSGVAGMMSGPAWARQAALQRYVASVTPQMEH